MKAFQLKYGDGGKKIYGVVKKGTAKRYKDMKSFDEGLHGIITNFQDAFGIAAKIENLTTDKNKIIDKSTPDHSHAEARSTMIKFPKVFKNSNLKTLQTITLTDPTFNQEIISKGGFESSRIKIYRTLNNYVKRFKDKGVMLKRNGYYSLNSFLDKDTDMVEVTINKI